jgi:hypothetical protein
MTTTMPTFETQQMAAAKPCRFCGSDLQRTFVDLGLSPLGKSYPLATDLNRGEIYCRRGMRRRSSIKANALASP